MENEIIKICEQLKILSKCPGCGGEIENGTCIFCGNTIKEFNELTKKLEDLLNSTQMTLNIYAELINIYNLKISCVNELVASKRDEMSQLLEARLSNNEYFDMINIISKDNASILVNPDYFFQIAKKYFCGEIKNMDDETYLKFIEIYIKNIITKSNFKSLYNHTPEIKFASKEEIDKALKENKVEIDFPTHGLCVSSPFGESILLNREIFLESRKTSVFENIITICHELQHLVQISYTKNKEKYNLIGFLTAKDKALTGVLPNYYSNNYELISFENDSEYNATMSMANDLEALGLSSLNMRERANYHAKLLLNPARVMYGQSFKVDELFDKNITDPGILKKYPILGIEYKVDNGKLKRKLIEEIMAEAKDAKTPELKVIYEYIFKNLNIGESTKTFKKS